MRIGRPLGVMSLVLCSSVMIMAQRASPDTNKTVRVDSKKPTVYLKFVKTGVCRHAESFTVLSENPCQSRRTDIKVDEFQAVWLRLVNNTRWAIGIDLRNSYLPPVVGPFTLQDKQTVTAVNDDMEVDPRYYVEADHGCDFHESTEGSPCKRIEVQAPVVEWMGVFTTVFLPPGRSLVFAVRRDHLAKYLNAYVPYYYEWEMDRGHSSIDEPKHRVFFSWYRLQQALPAPDKKIVRRNVR